MDRGGGLVVSIFAFYSDNPSSIPAGSLNFLYEKMKINYKEAGVGPSLKKVALLLIKYNKICHDLYRSRSRKSIDSFFT